MFNFSKNFLESFCTPVLANFPRVNILSNFDSILLTKFLAKTDILLVDIKLADYCASIAKAATLANLIINKPNGTSLLELDKVFSYIFYKVRFI